METVTTKYQEEIRCFLRGDGLVLAIKDLTLSHFENNEQSATLTRSECIELIRKLTQVAGQLPNE